jgi:uncharacterized protein
MIESQPADPSPGAPTAPADRIAVVDMLRGLAIFGILTVNMEGFSSAGYRAESGERLWTGLVDRLAESLIGHAAVGKFMIVFTVLFGLGFALQAERASARGVAFPRIQVRRLLVLLLIGLVHAHLIWWGDILVSYALAGFLLLLFRGRRPRTVLVWAIALNLLSFAGLELSVARDLVRPAAVSTGAPSVPDPAGRNPAPAAEAALQAYAHGSLAEITRQRVGDFWRENHELPEVVLRRLSFFLLGLFVGQLGILRNVAEHRGLLARGLKWALVVGVAAHAARFLLMLPGAAPWLRLLRLPMSIVGNPALAAAYCIGAILLFQAPGWRARLEPLAAVGRTALSNYLLQSVICTSIFYSYGLGLYGRVGPAAGLALTVGIFALQVPLSVWWLRRFRFGPVEWVWRSLTYGRVQPLRVTAGRVTTG